MTIKKMKGTITGVTDLSPSAREITFSLSEPIGFTPGAFVNLFVEKNGERLRRAYSISSDETDQNSISIALRKVPGGAVGPLFWNPEFLRSSVELMGPLGLNTVSALTARRIFLFGFGIGAGVIKSIATSLLRRSELSELVIMTGSKTVDEILFRDFFEQLSQNDARVRFFPVVSRPGEGYEGLAGYVQEHVGGYDFTDADVYMCGQEVACDVLQKKIKEKGNFGVTFLVEAFH